MCNAIEQTAIVATFDVHELIYEMQLKRCVLICLRVDLSCFLALIIILWHIVVAHCRRPFFPPQVDKTTFLVGLADSRICACMSETWATHLLCTGDWFRSDNCTVCQSQTSKVGHNFLLYHWTISFLKTYLSNNLKFDEKKSQNHCRV